MFNWSGQNKLHLSYSRWIEVIAWQRKPDDDRVNDIAELFDFTSTDFFGNQG